MSASAKMLLISILVMSIVLPARAASVKQPKKALKQAVVSMTLFNLFYTLAILFIYPRLL